MSESAACPRCGYDQRGLIATWEDSCPLEATCTECGLVFACAEALRPEKFEPRWCVEYCESGPRPFVGASLKTVGTSFLPWRFWSHLQMAHRIRPKRIALYLLVLLLPVLLLYLGAQTAVALYARALAQQQMDATVQWATNWAATAQFHYDLRPELLEELKLQQPDKWEAILEEHRERFERVREQNRRMGDEPPYFEHSAFLHVLEAVFLPFATESRLRVRYPSMDRSLPYGAPIELWEGVVSSLFPVAGAGWLDGFFSEVLTMPLHAYALGVLLALLFPLSLSLLPVSRRRAKVRWAHIARITAYSAFLPALIGYALAALIAFELSYAARAGAPSGFAVAIFILAIAGIPGGTLLWWAFAINRHLKMPHALATAVTLMFLCFLLVLATAYLISPEWVVG